MNASRSPSPRVRTSPVARFSLRALLLTMLLCALGLGVVRHTRRTLAARRQAEMLRAGAGRDALLVRDGQLVLVRRGDTFGVFIPLRQRLSPERLSFRWHFRGDGGGRFGSGDRGVRSGVGGSVGPARNRRARFGPFDLQWSACADGWGWVYYPRAPGEPSEPGELRICLTNAAGLEGLNARDARWLYRSSHADWGTAGNAECTGGARDPASVSDAASDRARASDRRP